MYKNFCFYHIDIARNKDQIVNVTKVYDFITKNIKNKHFTLYRLFKSKIFITFHSRNKQIFVKKVIMLLLCKKNVKYALNEMWGNNV